MVLNFRNFWLSIDAGFVALLSQLTDVGDLRKEKFTGAYVIMYLGVVNSTK